ncbi:hypothetical protein HZS38_04730 [Xenorhabdus nematophila]|nr:damage-inducible type I toxin DinQ [Xenorhabdus nematophila]MBA0018506.1 hypothetical protein [Xenorhabdus nematophila]
MNDFKVLTEQTGGAVFGALAGGSHSSSNNEKSVVTGSVRVNNGASLQVNLEKRMGAFIDKAIMVLKAIIVLLELIRIFF